jgi:predicted metalloprotease
MDRVWPVSQQQWGGQPAWRPGPPGPSGPGFGRPGLGPGFGGPQRGLPQYGPAPHIPQPRRRSPLGAVLLGLIALIALAIVGLVLANTTTSTSQVMYQNEDYRVPPPDANPPPLPAPDTEAEAKTLITKNPFYDQTAPIPVRCNSQPINVSTAGDAQLKAHFEGLMECLLRVWEPPVTRARFQIVRPTVTIFGKSITTKCGTSDVNAFYCAADQQVYYSNQLPDAVPIVAEDKWAADVVMAHEFGHALQARTGILVSSNGLAQLSQDKPTELEMSRRLETQADCFSGMFMRAVSRSLGIQQSDVNGILAVYRAVGDDALSGNPDIVGNHGHSDSREYWGKTGLGTSSVGECNTYTAPARLMR